MIDRTNIPEKYLVKLEKALAVENFLADINKSEIDIRYYRNLIDKYSDTLLFNNWLRMAIDWNLSKHGNKYWRKIALDI